MRQSKFSQILQGIFNLKLFRHKDIISHLITSKLADALVLYLSINSKEIIFYVLGVLINIVAHQDIRIQFSNDIFQGVN